MSSRDYLRVNAYLTTEMDARAIRSALDLGVIDTLAELGPSAIDALARSHRIHPTGLKLLAQMLAANGVVRFEGGSMELTPAFLSALRFRDLLESRIAFADLVWPDIHTLFTPLLNDLPQFMARSKVFDLFRYDRCFDLTPENIEATQSWTKFTTCLTKYEAGPALDEVGLDGVDDLIDMGGNTGEFAFRACQRRSTLQATVVDLPVVCELGRRRLAGSDEARRIGFFPTDMRGGALPAPADLVSFKSVLHDWPDAEARHLLTRAADLVRPGGRLLIFERAPIDVSKGRIPYAMAPDLVFLHFLRPADLYLRTLRELGFAIVTHKRMALDMDFHLIVAARPQR